MKHTNVGSCAPLVATTYVGEVASEDSSSLMLASNDDGRNALKISRAAGDTLPHRASELWAVVGYNAPVTLGVLR